MPPIHSLHVSGPRVERRVSERRSPPEFPPLCNVSYCPRFVPDGGGPRSCRRSSNQHQMVTGSSVITRVEFRSTSYVEARGNTSGTPFRMAGAPNGGDFVNLGATVMRLDDHQVVGWVSRASPRSAHVFRSLIARNTAVRHLFVAMFASLAADAMASLLLAQLLVFGTGTRPGPDAMLRAVLFATMPIIVFAPAAGALVDRVSRQSLLVFGHLARSGLTFACCVATVHSLRWVAYLALIALLGLSRVLYTCRSASIPFLVAPDDLVSSDSAMLTIAMAAGPLGAALGSVAAWTDPAYGFAFAAGLHLVAVRWYRKLPADLGGRTARARSLQSVHQWRTVRSELRRTTTRLAIVATAFHRLLLGAGLAVVVTVVDRRYAVSAPGYAMTLGVSGLGSFVGALAAPRTSRLPWLRHVSLACALPGVSFFVAALTDAPVFAMVSLMLAAFAFQNLRVSADARVQGAATGESVGRVFALYDMMFNLAFAVGAISGLFLTLVCRSGLLLAGISACYLGGAGLASRRSRPRRFSAKATFP